LKVKYYGYTCPECYLRPIKRDDSDWVKTTLSFANLQWPVRCRKCDTDYRRAKRTAAALRKLSSLSYNTHKQWPKLLTVGLPSYPGDDAALLLADLKKKWTKLRILLAAHGVSGGKYVYEMTQKIDWDTFLTKWHPHIHAVVICPYVQKRDLPEFSKLPLQVGLGRINIMAVKDLKHCARYISKYITKQDGFRSAQWGSMIGYKPPSFQKE